MSEYSGLISIVTPSLDNGAYILQTIRSIEKQTVCNFTYIIMDGDSTDNTIAILESYSNKYPWIKWISESDKNQSAAINKGWKTADGEILAWLNADDVYLPGTFKIVSDYFQRHPDVDIIYGDCDYMDDAGHTLEAYPTQPYNYANLIRFAVNYIPQPATFIRRRVVESVGFLDETLHYVMDYDYWLRIGLNHSIVYIPEKLAKMRLHSDAKSIKNLGGFSHELITIYTNFFNTCELPEKIRKLEKEALSHAYYRAAHIAFWAEQPEISYQYGRMALQLQPFSIRSWRLLLMSNRVGVRLANILKNNPYLLNIKEEKLF